MGDLKIPKRQKCFMPCPITEIYLHIVAVTNILGPVKGQGIRVKYVVLIWILDLFGNETDLNLPGLLRN